MNSFFTSVRAFPRAFWILAGATFVNRFGVFVVPFLTIYMTGRGFSPVDAGWAVAAYAAGGFLAAGLGGWLADRAGRNVTMAASSLLGAGFMLLLSRATGFPGLVVLAGLTGLCTEMGHPAGSALVQDLIPPEHRVTAFAILRWCINLGWALGPAAAGLVAEHSLVWLFAGDAATSAAFGIVALFWLPRGRTRRGRSAGWAPAIASIRGNTPFLMLFVASIAVSFLFRQVTTSFTLHVSESGVPLRWCGIILALNGVLICLFELPLTVYSGRWPVRHTIAAGYLVMGTAFLLLFAGSGLSWFLLFMAAFTVGEMLSFSRQQAYAAGLAPDDMRGRYSGSLSLAWNAGNILGATAGMRLFHAHPPLLWATCAVLGTGAATLLLPRPAPRTAPARPHA